MREATGHGVAYLVRSYLNDLQIPISKSTAIIQGSGNVGGEKVSPLEVESTLLEIPEVADCLVYGEPNVITGQIVAAEIVLRTGVLVDLKKFRRTIKQYCRKNLSPYKVPARITFNSATRFNERYKKTRNRQ